MDVLLKGHIYVEWIYLHSMYGYAKCKKKNSDFGKVSVVELKFRIFFDRYSFFCNTFLDFLQILIRLWQCHNRPCFSFKNFLPLPKLVYWLQTFHGTLYG